MKLIAGIFVVALAPVLGLSFSLPAIAQGSRPPAPPVEDIRPTPGRGSDWSADPRTGCWIWTAHPRPTTTVTWTGRCGPDGRASGRGVALWQLADGRSERFEGECRNGKPDGRGAFAWANGDRYEGEYRNGKESGKGAYRWRNGDRYEGQFRNRVPHGYGIFKPASGGQQLVGTWVHGCLRERRYCPHFAN